MEPPRTVLLPCHARSSHSCYIIQWVATCNTNTNTYALSGSHSLGAPIEGERQEAIGGQQGRHLVRQQVAHKLLEEATYHQMQQQQQRHNLLSV